jgi:hypothetical protein
MLAGGVVQPGGGAPGAVCAYVVLSAGHASRIFVVRGNSDAPEVAELPAATTIDLKRFERDVHEELRRGGANVVVASPDPDKICQIVEASIAKEAGR